MAEYSGNHVGISRFSKVLLLNARYERLFSQVRRIRSAEHVEQPRTFSRFSSKYTRVSSYVPGLSLSQKQISTSFIRNVVSVAISYYIPRALHSSCYLFKRNFRVLCSPIVFVKNIDNFSSYSYSRTRRTWTNCKPLITPVVVSLRKLYANERVRGFREPERSSGVCRRANVRWQTIS